MTRKQDIDALITVLKTFYFCALPDRWAGAPAALRAVVTPRVAELTVFPVKSAGGFQVSRWPLGPCGLLFDREWCITDAKGLALTQKAEPRLVLISCRVQLSEPGRDTAMLHLSAPAHPDFIMPFSADAASSSSTVAVTVCGEECRGVNVGGSSTGANAWLSTVLQRPVQLVRRNAIEGTLYMQSCCVPLCLSAFARTA